MLVLNVVACLTLSVAHAAGGVAISSHHTLGLERRFLGTNTSSTDPFDPFASKHFVGDLQCGVTAKVSSHSAKYEMCPEDCPYYAQDLEDEHFCSFVCVPASECKLRNPNRPIPDVVHGHNICRGPRVEDCAVLNYDGTDTCKECQMFYSVGSDGKCYQTYYWTIVSIVCVFLLLFAFGLIWVVDCCIRPITNPDALKVGLRLRSHQKIHKPINPDTNKAELWELNTNLCTTDIGAGPGMVLHFNAQVMIIVWATIVGLVWLGFCTFVDDTLFFLGARKFGTPRTNCILVMWGYEKQQALMWTKVTFLIIIYFFTFAFSLAHSIRQLRIFQRMNGTQKTMMDFAALVTGLPEISGNTRIEEELKDKIETATQKNVVGVSIGWNYKEEREKVEAWVEVDLANRDRSYFAKDPYKNGETYQERPTVEQKAEFTEGMGFMRKKLHNLELWSVEKICGGGDPETQTDEEIKTMLETMKTSDEAFVVFKTEQERDDAVENWPKDGLAYNESKLGLEVYKCEPRTVQWVNFGNSTYTGRMKRLAIGFGYILLALFFWTTVFYFPYAWQIYTFNFENGAEPPASLAIAFTMVVVVGNAIMYQVCAFVAEDIGFKTRDDRESCYLLLYVVACMFNVALDMVTTYYMAMRILEGLRFRTYHGTPIGELEHFTDQFEAYAMQRLLAENVKAYSFPATFLIPFLIEPFMTVIMPYKVGEVMVRTHREWVGRDAELWMQAWEFDMGRYGDLLLDMVLGNLIFFFPGGYTLLLFFGMAGSHAYIYLFDHLRVLNTIPKCVYANMDVDWWAQWMLAPITAMIVQCLVFKANCQDYGYCIQGTTLIEAQVATFAIHTVVHTLCLLYIVPMFGCRNVEAGPQDDWDYYQISAKRPYNWFSSNPVHCMRSKHIYGHKPPVSCSVMGKSHLQAENKDQGCCFSAAAPEDEDYSLSQTFRNTLSRASKEDEDASKTA